MTLNTKKIAILGGGFAGMHISGLINKKYPTASVHIYEENEKLGGKINTFTHQGDQYDMGAITGVRSVYSGVEKLFGTSYKTSTITTSVFNKAIRKESHLFDPIERIKLFVQILKYLILRIYFSFTQTQSILDLPFYYFCQKFHLHLVEIQFRAIFCGCGYGSNKSIPTFYVFSHAGFSLLFHLYFGGFRFYPQSIQTLLIKNFESQNPNTETYVNTTVTGIIHNDGKIRLATKDYVSQPYDVLIMACNPSQLIANIAPQNPFKKLNFLKYSVSLIEYEDLIYKTPHVISFETNMEDIQDHTPVMIFFKQPTKPFGLTYYYPLSTPNESLLRAELQNLGYRIKSILYSTQYDNYFPHFKSNTDHELKAIQGKDNIYYVGESITFSVLPSIIKSNKAVFSLMEEALKNN